MCIYHFRIISSNPTETSDEFAQHFPAGKTALKKPGYHELASDIVYDRCRLHDFMTVVGEWKLGELALLVRIYVKSHMDS